MSTISFEDYLKSIQKNLQKGSERSHYPALKNSIDAQTVSGILAFITNHGYLDNPTFRGIRQSLEKTFDKIYLLDWHGIARKRKLPPMVTRIRMYSTFSKG